jgi:hypothetical protein
MSTAIHRRLVAVAGAAALCVAVAAPGAALADRGGVPHNGKEKKEKKECPSQSKGKGTKKSLADLPSQAQDNSGKKCGFHKGNSNNSV